MFYKKIRWALIPLLCAGSMSALAWEARVTELWVKNGELRFILEDCAPYHFKIERDDADTPLAYDMLLSALLAQQAVTVYRANLDAFAACPTANIAAGSVRIQP